MERVGLIKKRATLRELAHEDVYAKSGYIGYVIKDSPLVGNELKWHFVTDDSRVPTLEAKTKKELVKLIESYL